MNRKPRRLLLVCLALTLCLCLNTATYAGTWGDLGYCAAGYTTYVANCHFTFQCTVGFTCHPAESCYVDANSSFNDCSYPTLPMDSCYDSQVAAEICGSEYYSCKDALGGYDPDLACGAGFMSCRLASGIDNCV